MFVNKNHKNERNTVTAVDIPEQQTEFDNNVLCEVRVRGGADWNSILAHAYQTLASLPVKVFLSRTPKQSPSVISLHFFG